MRIKIPGFILLALPGVPLLMFVLPWAFNRYPTWVPLSIVGVVIFLWLLLFTKVLDKVKMKLRLRSLMDERDKE